MNLGHQLFKYRGYIPVPFVIVMVLFAEPTAWSMATGFALACAGEFLRAWGVFYVGAETRVTGSGVGASRLVTSGPFSHTRNPLYVGNIMIYSGMGIMSMALFPWLQAGALLWFIFQYWMIVKNEEDFLRTQFGEEYNRYTRHVPRFLFTLSRYSASSPISIDWKAGWNSEQRTIQAFLLVSVIVLVIWILR